MLDADREWQGDCGKRRKLCGRVLFNSSLSENCGCVCVCVCVCVYMFLMRDETRKEERSKQDQTNNKAKQHSTPKAVTFPKKKELPQVGLEPTTLYYMCMYMLMYMLMRDEEGRKKEASKVIHVQMNKAKQHTQDDHFSK